MINSIQHVLISQFIAIKWHLDIIFYLRTQNDDWIKHVRSAYILN